MIPLYADTREPPKIFSLLRKHGVKHEMKALQVGDFVYDNAVMERKEICDFINSVRSGHLTKQLIQMEQNYKYCYLLISGSLKEAYFKGTRQWTVNHHVGILTSIAVRYPKVKILQFPNDSQLVLAVKKIVAKTNDGHKPTIMNTSLVKPLKSSMTNEHLRVMILRCFPKIGLKRAQKLVKEENISKALDKLIEAMT